MWQLTCGTSRAVREKGEASAVKAEVAAGEAGPRGRRSRRTVRRPNNGPSSELGRCGAVCEPVRGRGRRPVREGGKECAWADQQASRPSGGEKGRNCWAEGEKKGGPSGQMREGRFSSFFLFFSKSLFYF